MMAARVKVTQVRSGSGRGRKQNETLKGLGLGGISKSCVLEDTPSVRGMIDKVRHLVEVQDAG